MASDKKKLEMLISHFDEGVVITHRKIETPDKIYWFNEAGEIERIQRKLPDGSLITFGDTPK